MNSPFANIPIRSSTDRPETNELNDQFLKTPFVDLEESENPFGQEGEWLYEDQVDEEEAGFDLHESEDETEWEIDEEDDNTNDRESSIDEVFDLDSEMLYEDEDTSVLPVEPLPVPEKNPVPFAPLPGQNCYWPIITSHAKGREVAFQRKDKKFTGNVGRRFLAGRTDGKRYHVGIDLWANDKDPIVACEDGKIVNFYHFYRSTYALIVEHPNIVVNYGEVHKDSLAANNLKIGDNVKAGQVIGIVGKMYSSSMLHFETYIKGTRSNKRFHIGKDRPKEMLNPTRYLLFLQRNGQTGKGRAGAGTMNLPAKNPPLSPKQPVGVPKPSKADAPITSSDSIVAKIKKYSDHIERISKEQTNPKRGKINPNIVRGIIAAESGGNADSGKGKGGYKGLMQAYRDDSSYAGKKDYHGNQLDPAVSIRSGIEKFLLFQNKILNPWLERLGIKLSSMDQDNYLKMSLSCYNAGPVTALKAIQYAHKGGDWRQWLSPSHYQRALAFSGGYDQYSVCSKDATTDQIAKAKSERLKHRFKSKNWKTESDPATWADLIKVMNPITRCWIETKYRNTPGYLDRFIKYFKFFESNLVSHELEDYAFNEADDQFTYNETEDQFTYEEDLTAEEGGEEEANYEEPLNEEQMEWENEAEAAEDFMTELAFEEDEQDAGYFHETETDPEYADSEDFSMEDEFGLADEIDEEANPVDYEEWEEDQLESSRSDDESEDLENFDDLESEIGGPGTNSGTAVLSTTFKEWLNSVIRLKSKFPDEPDHNLDQLPIPKWINPQKLYHNFIDRHGKDAKTIIGDATKKVTAKYFVLHDTAGTTDYTQKMIKGKGIHLWINAKSACVQGHDWHVKGLGVKLERRRNNSFVHVEIVRDQKSQDATRKKTKGKKITYQDAVNAGGLKKIGTYYTDRQYELAAIAYLVASVRKGSFLTVTIHREVDRSVVLKRKDGTYGYGHNDPQFFDLDYFYDTVCRFLSIPVKATFGIQASRAMTHNQGNKGGNVNAFIPFVTGDATAANQYGKLTRFDPKTIKYKVVDLKKNGYNYDVTGLKNNFKEGEVEEEMDYDYETPKTVTDPASSTPQFIAEDVTFPGYTCYVRIDIGKANYPMTMTGIYVPETFDPKKPIDVILYLHGMTGTFPGPCAQIMDHWTIPNATYDLRTRGEINVARKNIVFVAPSISQNPNRYPNRISGTKNGLDNYLENVLKAVNEYIVRKRFNASPIMFRNVILSAHSAGGMQMLRTVMMANPVYGPKVVECWGFDSLYGGVVDSWLDWAKKNKDKRLFIYYQGTTQTNSLNLQRYTKNLPNVFIKKSPAKNHYWVVREHLKERVMKIGEPSLTKMNFEEYAEEVY